MRKITEHEIMETIERVDEILTEHEVNPSQPVDWFVDDEGNLVGGFGDEREAINFIALTFLYLAGQQAQFEKQRLNIFTDGGISGLPN